METAVQKSSSVTTPKLADIYQKVTDTIIQQLEAGTIPWQQPWIGGERKSLGLPYNYTTHSYYQGINILLLWTYAIKNNYASDEWAGFQQWKDRNEFVRKGEKGNLVVFFNTLEKEVDGEIQKIPYQKQLFVFNRCQLASYNQEEQLEQQPKPSLVEKIAIVDEFLANTKAIIEHHDGGACYNRTSDKIFMPYPEKFTDTATCTATEGYYSTILHEAIHWVGASHRLNRTKGKQFGDKEYAVEELTAEFGAAFLCAGFGLKTIEKGDHAGYIENWLKVLKENSRCLFAAASEASKATDYLHHINHS